MSARTFAPWVQSTAERLRESREEAAQLADAFPENAWRQASPVPGWGYRDILAHLAEGDVFCQLVLRAVINGDPLDLRPQSARREGRTAGILAAGRGRTLAELIEEIRSEGDETQALLAALTPEHEGAQVITSNSKPEPVTLREFLEVFRHDEEHIAHLRQAQKAAS